MRPPFEVVQTFIRAARYMKSGEKALGLGWRAKVISGKVVLLDPNGQQQAAFKEITKEGGDKHADNSSQGAEE